MNNMISHNNTILYIEHNATILIFVDVIESGIL